MPSFHPGCRVTLRLRLDEGADSAPLLAALRRDNAARSLAAASSQSNVAAAAGAAAGGATAAAKRRSITAAKIAQAQKKGKIPGTDLEAQNAEIEAERQGLEPGRVGLPKGLTDGVDLSRTIDIEVRPKKVSVERPNTIDAAKATVVIDYRSLPFDPRIVRSCGVTVMLGEVTEEEFASGIVDNERRSEGADGVSPDRLPYSSELPRGYGLIRFEGFADSWNVRLGEGADEVEITARDLSSVLRDLRLPDGVGIDLSIPIVDGVKEVLSAFPATTGIPVVFGPAQELSEEEVSAILTTPTFGDGEGPIPAESQNRLKPKVGAKGKPGKPKAIRKGEKNQPLWDHLVTTCVKVGLMPVLRGRILFLQTAQAQAKAGEPWVLFYGRDLLDLSFTRKLEGVNQQTIEIRVPDPTIGRTRWARYPVLQGEPTSGVLGVTNPVTSRPNKVTPAGTPEERILTFEFDKVWESKTLEGMAKQVFEQVARQEIQGSLSTRLLRVQRLARARVPGIGRVRLERRSILDMWPGDSVLVLVAPAQEVATALQTQVTVVQQTYKELAQTEFARRLEALVAVGLSRSTAEKVARAQELVNNGSKFQVHGVKFEYSADDGLGVTVDFQNFVAVRDEEADTAVRAAQEAAIQSARADAQRQSAAASRGTL